MGLFPVDQRDHVHILDSQHCFVRSDRPSKSPGGPPARVAGSKVELVYCVDASLSSGFIQT